MAKIFSSLCCCSCCSLLSPSPPQPIQQPQHISTLPSHQQTITNTGHSTTSSPSQPSEQKAISTMADFKKFLQKFNDISQIEGLIPVLEELLKIASGEESDGGGSNSAAGSYIQDGKIILEMLDKRIGKRPVKLNEQISEQKLNEGIQCIVVGTSMCISQIARANIFRFLTATVTADNLKAFQVKIDRLYTDIQLSITIDIEGRVIDIGDRVPKIASESQKIYAYQPRVGIERAQESVIQLPDLNAQDTIPIVVVVNGFGGIGKTTLADAVYAQLKLQSYKHCRIHMDQNCTNNDLKVLQQQILNGLFGQNLQLKDCDEGRARLWSFFKQNPNQPYFLYIDNGLRSTDLEKLLPEGLVSCLPQYSRMLITTRNLQETCICQH